MQMNALVIYHKYCTDGLIAGILESNELLRQGYTVVTHAADYGNEPPWELIEKSQFVSIVDFSYPLETLTKMVEDNTREVRVYDHHDEAVRALITDAKALEDYDAGLLSRSSYCDDALKIIASSKMSGAMLVAFTQRNSLVKTGITFDEFNLATVVSDRDLWKFSMGDLTREVHLGLGVLMKNGTLKLEKYPSKPFQLPTIDQAQILGKPLFDMANGLYKEAVSSASLYVERCTVGKPDELQIMITNTLGSLASDTCDLVLRDKELDIRLCIAWFVESDGQVKLSFRSNDGESAKRFAKKLGGGGHDDASGARTRDIPQFLHFIELNCVRADA